MSPHVALLLAVTVTLGTACAAGPSTSTPTPTSTPISTRAAVSIRLAHDSPAERATKVQLERLLATHDLAPWLMTKEVVIDERAIPHSHPVLTLHTRHLDNDDHLLSTFIHEQMHWWLDGRATETEAAVAELRVAFPSLPVGYPDGARSERSSYEHLVVILLEQRGLVRLLGRDRAEVTFDFWQGDHYRALYRLVRTETAKVEAVARLHALLEPSS